MQHAVDVAYIIFPYIALKQIPNFLHVCKAWFAAANANPARTWFQLYVHTVTGHLNLLQAEQAQLKKMDHKQRAEINLIQIRNYSAKMQKKPQVVEECKQLLMDHVTQHVLYTSQAQMMLALCGVTCQSIKQVQSKWLTNFQQALPKNSHTNACVQYTEKTWKLELQSDICWIAQHAPSSEIAKYWQLMEKVLDLVKFGLTCAFFFDLLHTKQAQSFAMDQYEKLLHVLQPKLPLIATAMFSKQFDLIKVIFERNAEAMYFFPKAANALAAKRELLTKHTSILRDAIRSYNTAVKEYLFSFGVFLPIHEERLLKNYLQSNASLQFFSTEFVLENIPRLVSPYSPHTDVDMLYAKLAPTYNLFQHLPPDFHVQVAEHCNNSPYGDHMLEHLCVKYKSKIFWNIAKLKVIAKPDTRSGKILRKYKILR